MHTFISPNMIIPYFYLPCFHVAGIALFLPSTPVLFFSIDGTWTCYPTHKHWCGISGNNEWRNWYKNDLVDPFLHSHDKKSWWFKVSWSSDAYIHQKTGQSLVQILACIWVTPCHYLDQWWHIVSWVPWIIDNNKRWWIWKHCLRRHNGGILCGLYGVDQYFMLFCCARNVI